LIAKSLTDIKRAINSPLSTQKIYKILSENRVVERRFRKSQKSDEIKSYWVVIDNEYGINIDSPFSNSSTPKFFEDAISKLLIKVEKETE
jgi:hypothetical protein